MERKNLVELLLCAVLTNLPGSYSSIQLAAFGRCVDTISVRQCRFLRRHHACSTHEKRMKILCPDTCGFCPRTKGGRLDGGLDCTKTEFGCCRDGITPAKGPNYWYGCEEPCRDEKSKRYCVMIKKAGFCTSQRSLYYKDCLKTCDACRNCVDDRPEHCDSLLQYALCDKKKVKAWNSCRRSCHKCGRSDPCFGFRCPNHDTCRVDHDGTPFCACHIHCEDDDHYTGPLCGMDGIEYKNLCRFKHKNCKENTTLAVRNYGSCNSEYNDYDFPGMSYMRGPRKDPSHYDENLPGHIAGALVMPSILINDLACKNKLSNIFCKRFIPACGYESNREHMREYCQKTCNYCSSA